MTNATQTEFRFPHRSTLEHAARLQAEADFREREAQRAARKYRELLSDLAAMVEAGDLTAEQANEWANDKADAWFGGVA